MADQKIKSLQILKDVNEKTFNAFHKSNNFLDEKAYNLIKAIGVILSIMFLSVSYLFSDVNAVKNIFEVPLLCGIQAKYIILLVTMFASAFYIQCITSLIFVFRKVGFERISLSEENIEEFSRKSERDVLDMVATVFAQDIPKLEALNDKKYDLLKHGINNMIIGIVITVILMTLIVSISVI